MAWLVTSIVLAAEACCTDSSDFAQREQLLVILVIPYVLAALLNLRGTLSLWQRIALGIAGGLAISFKPQQTLIIAGLEIFLLLWYRKFESLWRPELIALVTTVLAYLVMVRIFAFAYIQQIVPILRDTYASNVDNSSVVLRGALLPFAACWFAVLAAWIWQHKRLRLPVVPAGLLTCALSAAAAFSIQREGYRYQAVPQNAFLTLAAAWLLIDFFGPHLGNFLPQRRSRLRLGGTVLLFASIFLPPLLLHGRHNLEQWRQRNYMQSILARYPPGTPVWIFSTSMTGFRDVLQGNLVWSSRYAHLWMLPAIVYNEAAEAGGPPSNKPLPPARVRQLAQLLRSNVAQDMHRWKPQVVVFDRITLPNLYPVPTKDGSYDTLGWFLRSHNFSTEWSHYHLQESGERYDIYTRKMDTTH